MGCGHSDLLYPLEEAEENDNFSLPQPRGCAYLDDESMRCTAKLWERCFTIKALEMLTERFQLADLSTRDVAKLFLKPITEASSTNFIHALVDGDLDFSTMPKAIIPNISDVELQKTVDELCGEIGPVTVFVCHSWSTKWGNLIDMLKRIEKQLISKGGVTVGDPAGLEMGSMKKVGSAGPAAVAMPFGKAARPGGKRLSGLFGKHQAGGGLGGLFGGVKTAAVQDTGEASKAAAVDSEAGPVTESFHPKSGGSSRPRAVTESYQGGEDESDRAPLIPEQASELENERAATSEETGDAATASTSQSAPPEERAPTPPSQESAGSTAIVPKLPLKKPETGPTPAASSETKNIFAGHKIHFFLDIFAVRQSYAVPGCGVHNHHMLPDYQFPYVIRKAKVFAAAWEPWYEPRILSRAWCLNEMAHAKKAKRPIELMMGPRYYDMVEAAGADQMKSLVERLKFTSKLSQAIHNIDLEGAHCFEPKETKFLIRDTINKMPGEGSINGRLRRAFVEPLVRMSILDSNLDELEKDFPDTPRIPTPRMDTEPKINDEDTEEEIESKLKDMGVMGAARLASMFRKREDKEKDEEVTDPEALIPRLKYKDNSKWTLEGHKGSVWCCAFSPCGRYITSGGSGGLIKIWVLKTGLEKCTLVGHKGAVLCLAWSSWKGLSGKEWGRIVSGGEDKTLKVWDTATGLLVATCAGHLGGVNCVAIDPVDMGWMISGGRGHYVKVWSIHGGSALQTLPGHADSVLCIAIAPSGEFAISGSVDRTVKVWDVVDAQTTKMTMVIKRTLYDHTSAVWTCAVTSTGKYFITGSSDCTIKIWSSLLFCMHANINLGEYIYHVSLSLDGRRIAAVCSDYTAKVYDVTDKKKKDTPIAVYEPSAFSYWDTEDGLPPPGALDFKQPPSTKEKFTLWYCDISPDGNWLVTSGDDNRLKVWNTRKTIGFSIPGRR
mmetsp:Transcript_31114/g.43116  ORF Transcript_31114/g.43116 Transcript_31114/m.43116 type:complete len:948 (+) Transcript_31114:104-2947(+)